jgi:hypothetical protein
MTSLFRFGKERAAEEDLPLGARRFLIRTRGLYHKEALEGKAIPAQKRRMNARLKGPMLVYRPP